MTTLPILHVIQAERGDCLLLEFSETGSSQRKFWLIDGGPGNQTHSGTYKTTNNHLFATLNDDNLNINRLERVVVTHNDKDHTWGAYAVISTLANPGVAETEAKFQEYLKFVSWKKGYGLLNKSTPQFPISHVWFNDTPQLAAKFSGSGSNTGWLDTLLKNIKAQLGTNGNIVPVLNDDCTDNLAMIGTGAILNISHFLGPNNDHAEELYNSGKIKVKRMPTWNMTAEVYHSLSTDKKYAADIMKWAELENTVKKGDKDTKTNLSSIMFEFFNAGKRILMTGDGCGTDIYEAYGGTKPATGPWPAVSYLPHHGSSNNNIVQDRDVYENVGPLVRRFFQVFRAYKYVISADTLSSAPNPDLNAMYYMGTQFASETAHPVRAVYVTNGVTYKCWKWFYYGSNSTVKKRNDGIKLKALINDDPSGLDYGSVVPSINNTDVGGRESAWVNFNDAIDWCNYFVLTMPGYFDSMLAEAVGTTPRKKAINILPRLLTLSADTAAAASNSATGAIRRRRQKEKFSPYDAGVVRRKSTRVTGKLKIDLVVPLKSQTTKVVASNLLMKASVLTPSPTIRPGVTTNVHDIIVANLLDIDDLTAQYSNNITMPMVIPAAQVLADGVTESCVDLSTLINLLESSNSKFIPTKYRPRLDVSYFQTLKSWFLNTDGTKPADTILASLLLNALMSSEAVGELLIALPINPNGAVAYGVDPFAAFQSGKPPTTLPTNAITNMVLQNFCATVIVPTDAQFAAGKFLKTISFYFEIGLPPKELCSLDPADILTWTLPFSNDIWTPGQVLFKHSGSLKVKIMWPDCQNSITFCSFNSNLTVSRTSPTTLPVRGKMYAERGRPAAYDIEIVGDNQGHVKALDIINLLSPEAALATTLLNKLVDTVNIPGIDVSKILNNDLVLQDAGLLLRQHQPNLPNVAIQDLYGTIATSAVFQLAMDLLPFPAGIQIPQNLPNLTVGIANIVGEDNNKVSLSFAQPVDGLGSIIFQVARGYDGNTIFDIFTLTDDSVSVGQVLAQLSNAMLLSQFEAARVFTDALSGLFVPYAHLSFGPTSSQPGASYALRTLTVAIDLEANVSIPSNSPIITLEDISFEFIYTASSGNIGSDISLFGTCYVSLGGFDAVCTFRVDHTEDEIEAYLDDDFTVPTGPTPGDSTGGFEGLLYLDITFPNNKPSIGDILDTFLNDIGAGGLVSLSQNIPTELLSILDGNELQVIEFQIQKDSTTSGKWQMTFFHVSANLEGLDDVLKLLPGIDFSVPVLDIFIHAPGDPVNRTYEVSLGSWFSLKGGLCNLAANFDSPPTGFQSNPGQAISVSLQPDNAHPGLPLGAIVTQYVGVALDALDVNIANLVPQEVKDVVSSITLDQAMFSFINTGTAAKSSWKSKLVEVAVSSAHAPWSPFESFQISNVQLHFIYDFGVDPNPANVVPATTQVQFNTDLTVGTNVIKAGFTYESAKNSWTITVNAGQTIHLVDLILSGIQNIGLEIPSSIVSDIEKILVIDTTSFYLSYSPGDASNPEMLSFSNDGLISLFGVSVSNISVFCQKTSGGPWSYTVALTLPSPCEPLSGFSPFIPGLAGIQISDGKFAFFKGQPSTQVIGKGELPSGLNSSSIILSGKILFKGSSFMQTIKNLVSLDEVDIAILPGIFSIAIPAASMGLNIMNVFQVLSFSLEIYTLGFGLGATVQLTASWLSKTPVQGSFLLIVSPDGAFGAKVSLDNITNPFGLPGISLVDASFSLVWLPEAFEPQSLSAAASILVTEKGADPITGSFAMSMDETNSSQDYFRINIENLTLVNMVNTLTNGSCPDELKAAQIGFKELDIDLEMGIPKFKLNADFYLFTLEGKAVADVEISTGVSFAANTNIVDILGLIKIHAYKNGNLGPFTYLDTTIKSIASGTFTTPPWLGVTSKDDPNLKGAVFALSATLVFLGAELDVYGIVNTSGLKLTVSESSGLSLGDQGFHLIDSFNIVINDSFISAGTKFHFDLSLHLPNINIVGIDLGSYDGTMVSLDDDIQITVNYSGTRVSLNDTKQLVVNYAATDWHNDGLEFYVQIDASVLGLDLDAKLNLDVTITDLDNLASAIETFVTNKVVDYLVDKIAGPIIKFGKEALAAAEDAIDELKDGFNILGDDIVSILTDAGHEVEAIAGALKNSLSYTIDEVATALSDFGHDVNTIASVVGNVFEAAPQEVLSALTSAGVTIEHAVGAVFDDAGAELSKDFNLVGNSVAGFALDAEATIQHFLTDNVKEFAENTVSSVGNFFEGVGDDISNFFSGGDCDIM